MSIYYEQQQTIIIIINVFVLIELLIFLIMATVSETSYNKQQYNEYYSRYSGHWSRIAIINYHFDLVWKWTCCSSWYILVHWDWMYNNMKIRTYMIIIMYTYIYLHARQCTYFDRRKLLRYKNICILLFQRKLNYLHRFNIIRY